MRPGRRQEGSGLAARLPRGARWGARFLLGLGLLALCADLLAGDLPLLLRLDKELFVLPVVSRPAALRAEDNQSLSRRLDPARGDWLVTPLCPFGPTQQPTPPRPLAPPNGEHWLGTDDRGRDVFARLVHGSRVAALVGGVSVAINLVLGLGLGLCAGYFRGRVDWIVARLIELGLSFPSFFLIITLMALQQGGSLWTLVLVLGLTRWTRLARLARAEALRLRGLDFVLAARACGAGHGRILLHHLLPNALAPILVQATFALAGAMVIEAGLSFLGFGTPPPTASWGEVMGQGYEAAGAWWLTLFPGALLFATVLSLNLLAEGLRDALDPRQG